MRRIGLAFLLLWAYGSLAYAQAPTFICNPVQNSQTGQVNCTLANFGDSGPVSVIGTPANSSHAAGTAVGPTTSTLSYIGSNQTGLFVIPFGKSPGNGGIVTNFLLKSTGGSTGQYIVRMWSQNPVNTTCKDNTAFVSSDNDDAFLIGPGPFSIIPAAPASTTGDSATYASSVGITYDYLGTDVPATGNIYVCIVTVSTNTADNNHQIRITLSGPRS